MTRLQSRKRRYRLLAFLPLAIAAFLFVGVEEHLGEHESRYELFMKQWPTLTTFYVNSVACGTCEVPSFDNFAEDRHEAFAEYCRVRYDLTDIRVCHAIFYTQQVIIFERLGLL